MKRAQGRRLAKAASKGDTVKMLRELDLIIAEGNPEKVSTWAYFASTLKRYLLEPQGKTPYSIFGLDGNGKLPFVTWSTVPIYTCPGMGECESFCFSLKAWRYPAAYFRQVMNTWLLKTHPEIVAEAFHKIPKNHELRLYVDGDIDSVETLEFWMNLIRNRPDLHVYGYSKSWEILAEYDGEYPTNYVFNMSSGSRHEADAALIARVEALSITRGKFVAVDIPRKLAKLPNATKYTDPRYIAAVREAGKKAGFEKAFICPGKCGFCTKKQHACGDHRFDNVPVLIGIH